MQLGLWPNTLSHITQPILKQYFLCRYTCMFVSENITCTSAYNSRGCSLPLFGSYTGSESSFTSISTRKSLSLVKDKTRFSGSGRAASLSPSLPRSISTFPVSATPPEVRLLRPLSLVFASKGIPRFCILS